MNNYSSLTLTELSSLAETDAVARQYVVDNDGEYIDELNRMKEQYSLDLAESDEAFDNGVEDLRDELRERFCGTLAWEKAKTGVERGIRAMLADLQSCFECDCDDDGEKK